MTRALRRCVSLALTVTAAGATLRMGAGRIAVASPPIVDLLASRGSRLADDLRRELGTSGFLVVVVPSTSADWRADVLRLAGHPPIHGVVVRADERLMTVFTRTTIANAVEAHLEQTVDPRDRLARRRACLGVVEYLRVLSENDPAAPFDLTAGGSSARTTTPSPSGPSSSAPSPTDGSSPAKAEAALALAPASPPSTPRATASAPAGAATPALASLPVAAGRKGTAAPASMTRTVAPQAAWARAVSPPESSGAPASVRASGQEPPPGNAPAMGSALPENHSWELGAGSMLDLQASPGGPTVNLQFLWYLPLEWRLAICVRALWPVLGAQFKTGGNDIRLWTFGGAASLQYLFKTGSARLRPFVGAAVGTRVALTETTAVDALQSRETFTPSATLGVDTGMRYSLSPLIQLFLEVGLVRGWLIPGVHRATYEEQAANSDSFHASFGVLFEI